MSQLLRVADTEPAVGAQVLTVTKETGELVKVVEMSIPNHPQ